VTDARGIGLVDALVSVALGTLMATFAVPFVGGAMERERTIIGTRYLASQLQRARLESLMRARAVAVRVELEGARTALQLFADGNGNGVSQRDIARGIDPPLTLREYLDVRARDVSLRINQPVTDISGSGTLAPGDDPLRIGNSALVTFSPVGSATSGTLYVAAPRGPQLAIRIFGGTGRVRVLNFDARARQWRP
jgi:hypothetical protein